METVITLNPTKEYFGSGVVELLEKSVSKNGSKKKSTIVSTSAPDPIIYLESDGKPMADNTKQYEWISKIKWELENQYEEDKNVFVAGDLLWYPKEGDNKIRIAPDAMVVFGTKKHHRGSYKQWEENGIAPQVVFEIWSPGNSKTERTEKKFEYESYGVEEYYEYDPDRIILKGWIRKGFQLEEIPEMEGWVSPRLGVRFEMKSGELKLFHPDGSEFITPLETAKKAKTAEQQVLAEKRRTETAEQQVLAESQRAETEKQRAETAEQQVLAERQRAEFLAQKLQELGVEL